MLLLLRLLLPTLPLMTSIVGIGLGVGAGVVIAMLLVVVGFWFLVVRGVAVFSTMPLWLSMLLLALGLAMAGRVAV